METCGLAVRLLIPSDRLWVEGPTEETIFFAKFIWANTWKQNSITWSKWKCTCLHQDNTYYANGLFANTEDTSSWSDIVLKQRNTKYQYPTTYFSQWGDNGQNLTSLWVDISPRMKSIGKESSMLKITVNS